MHPGRLGVEGEGSLKKVGEEKKKRDYQRWQRNRTRKGMGWGW